MIKDLSLSGLKLIELKMFRDDRGFFTERYVQTRFHELGLPAAFVQDNHSRSKPGVIRGLHYQVNPAQGKLVGVIRGKILDIAVDIRKSSPTFGQWEAVELSDDNGRMLWIPAGFAHGFAVIGNEDADVIYKVDATYSPNTEGGIRFDDPDLKLPWPKTVKSVVSVKDQALPSFSEYIQNPSFS